MHGSTITMFTPLKPKETKVVNIVESDLLSLEGSIAISKKFIQRWERIYMKDIIRFNQRAPPSVIFEAQKFFFDQQEHQLTVVSEIELKRVLLSLI